MSSSNSTSLCNECELMSATLYCEECRAELCDACSKRTHALRIMRNHNPVAIEKRVNTTCQLHPGKELALYCMSCNSAICVYCERSLHIDSSSSPHQVCLLPDAANKMVDIVKKRLEEGAVIAESLAGTSTQIGQAVQEMRSSRDLVRSTIENDLNSLVLAFEAKKNALLQQFKNENENTTEMDAFMHKLAKCSSDTGDAILAADSVINSAAADSSSSSSSSSSSDSDSKSLVDRIQQAKDAVAKMDQATDAVKQLLGTVDVLFQNNSKALTPVSMPYNSDQLERLRDAIAQLPDTEQAGSSSN